MYGPWFDYKLAGGRFAGKCIYVAEHIGTCAAFIDQLEGAAEHVNQHINLVVVAKTPLPRLLAFVAERGWRRLRFLSSANNPYNADYHAQTAEGAQRPMLTVFHRDADAIRHFWSSELFYAPNEPGEDPRHVGTVEHALEHARPNPRGTTPRLGGATPIRLNDGPAAQNLLARSTGTLGMPRCLPGNARLATPAAATRGLPEAALAAANPSWAPSGGSGPASARGRL